MATVVRLTERASSRGRAKATPAAAKARSSSVPGSARQPAAATRSSSVPSRGGKGSGKGGGAAAGQPRFSWEHPEGIPLEELNTEVPHTGVVVNINQASVFIDVGARRNGILRCPLRFSRLLRRGDVLHDLLVVNVNPEANRFALSCEDLLAAIQKNRRPLEEFHEGMHVDGVVDNKNQFGTFVNIRSAFCHGRLRLPRVVSQNFVRGQVLRNLCVETVDLESQRVAVSLEDPEAAVANLELVSHAAVSSFAPLEAVPRAKRAKAKAKARAATPPPTERAAAAAQNGAGQDKTKAKPAAEPQAQPDEEPKKAEKALAATVPPARRQRKPASPAPAPVAQPLEAGDLVDGVVVEIGDRGVLVNIGLDKPGILMVSEELKQEFMKGDRVQGMTVDKVGRLGTVFLAMEDPELAYDEIPASQAQQETQGASKVQAKVKAKTRVTKLQE